MSRHLSEDQICRAIAGQSTIDEQRHVRECPHCRNEIERSWNVLAAFRTAAIARAEREALRSTPSLGAQPNDGWRWQPALAATALVAVVAALIAQLPGQRREALPAGGTSTQAPMAVAGEFFPLAYSNVPITDGRIVRIEVPRSAASAFGVDPVDLVSARHRDAVLADVVVGVDGLARAVRFVRPGVDDLQEGVVP
ncbi:MAG TPA: hypothetical protein VFV95_01845 [Vicinamibacterales bacterium]|nr:hypothetical protein [Vicinamibacterales bacterium]